MDGKEEQMDDEWMTHYTMRRACYAVDGKAARRANQKRQQAKRSRAKAKAVGPRVTIAKLQLKARPHTATRPYAKSEYGMEY
eukprot:3965243-Heterocapsa_arctica.AAC.1